MVGVPINDITSTNAGFSLTPEQRAAVGAIGSVFVEAGPGTGKTHVLAARVAMRVATGADPRRILVLTFSRRATGELRDRINRDSGVSAEVRTFHGFASRLMVANGQRFKSHRLLDGFSQALVLRSAIADSNLLTILPIAQSSNRFREDAARFAADLARNPASAVASLRANATPRLSDLITIADGIRNRRERLGASDINDLVTRAVDALTDPMSPQSLWLRDRYTDVIIDEFQDVDLVQLALIERIGAPVFAVGDPAQSVYRFRGAVRGVIDDAIDRFSMSRFTLSESRRCPQPLCDLAAATPFLNAVPLRSAAGGDGQIDYRSARTIFDEAALIADEVEDAVAAGTPPNRIAVLLRSMRPLGPTVIGELRRRGVTVAAAGRELFFADSRIELMRAALEVLARPSDTLRWHRLLSCPGLGFDSVRVRMLIRPDAADSLETMLSTLESAKLTGRYPHEVFANTLREAATAFEVDDIGLSAKRIANGFDVLVDLTHAAGSVAVARANIARVTGFVEALAEGQRTLAGLNEPASSRIVLEASGTEPNAIAGDGVPDDTVPGVRLLTIHGAKGLEFDFVVVGDAVEGRFPSAERRSTLLDEREIAVLSKSEVDVVDARGDAALVEEAALWYVAVTRSRKRLLVTFSAQGIEGTPQRVSRFVPADRVPTVDDAPFERQLGRIEYDLLHAVGDAELTQALRESVADSPIVLALANEGAETFAAVPARGVVAEPSASVTSVGNWLRCPRLFFYATLLRLGRPSSIEAEFGNAIHRILNQFHTEVADLTIVPPGAEQAWRERLLALRAAEWPSLTFETPAHREATAASADRMLRAYTAYLIEQVTKEPFTVQATEADVVITFDSGRLRGTVDRIDRLGDGSLVIRDYKTGKVRPSFGKALEKTQKTYQDGGSLAGRAQDYFSPQLALYRSAVESSFNARVAELEYIYLKGDSKAPGSVEVDRTTLDDVTLARLRFVEDDVDRNLLQALANGTNELVPMTNDTSICDRCEYGGLCPGSERL